MMRNDQSPRTYHQVTTIQKVWEESKKFVMKVVMIGKVKLSKLTMSSSGPRCGSKDHLDSQDLFQQVLIRMKNLEKHAQCTTRFLG